MNDAILQNFSPTSLIAAIDANEIAYNHMFSHLPGAELYDEVDLFWMASGIPVSLFNGILLSHTTEKALGPAIERVLTYFRERKLPFNWHVGPGTQPRNIREILPLYGIRHDENEPGMALDLRNLNEEVAINADLEVVPVTNDALLLQWLRTWGFPVPEEIISHCFRAYAPLYGESQPLRFYLGLLAGRPVATGALFEGAGVASVQHIVTIPEVRRQGVGAAITLAVLREIRALGYRASVLRASPDGINIYRRLGFREYCTMSTYVWSPL
jgi:GNAT superfamily N-acetyltransferase